MIQVSRLSPETVETLTAHLNGMREHLSEDVSSYAKGRQRFWLEYEAPLSLSRPWVNGVHDERLWSWITRQFKGEFELGLCAYGSVGIALHRDAFYAAFPAVCINLGEIDGWLYDRIYPEYSWVPPSQQLPSNLTQYPLESGSVVRFNCKNPHAPVNPGPERWSVNLWRVSTKARAAFEEFKSR